MRNQGDELRHLIEKRIKTKTPFRVEYGRYSGKRRGGAPTLVPHPKGDFVEAEILVLKASVSVKNATDMLWRREAGELDTSIGYPAGTKRASVQVRTLSQFEGVEVVLYTDFLDIGKIASPVASELATAAIESVAKAPANMDGITYLAGASADRVRTPLTDAYIAAILDQSGTNSLQDSLEKLRRKPRE
jgi:hypothetical protein